MIKQLLVHFLNTFQKLANDVRCRGVYRLHLADDQPEPCDFIGEDAKTVFHLFVSAMEVNGSTEGCRG